MAIKLEGNSGISGIFPTDEEYADVLEFKCIPASTQNSESTRSDFNCSYRSCLTKIIVSARKTSESCSFLQVYKGR